MARLGALILLIGASSPAVFHQLQLWTVPFGGGVGKLVKLGEQPIDIKGQLFWNAIKPDGAATVAAQLQVKFLFPK